MTDSEQIDMNPYRPPQSIRMAADSEDRFRHRNFQLTMIDEVNENRHFVIGNLRGAMAFSFLQQAVWMIFMAFVPDVGFLFRLSALSVVVFWSLIVITALVQRGDFSSQQTLAVKWGFMPVFLIVCNVVNVIVIVSRTV